MVLLLLVQHVLLLRLLQGPLIHLPPVHLLQLLTLLKAERFVQAGRRQARPARRSQQMQTRPRGPVGRKGPREENGVLEEQLTRVCGDSRTKHTHIPCRVSERIRPRVARG